MCATERTLLTLALALLATSAMLLGALVQPTPLPMPIRAPVIAPAPAPLPTPTAPRAVVMADPAAYPAVATCVAGCVCLCVHCVSCFGAVPGTLVPEPQHVTP